MSSISLKFLTKTKLLNTKPKNNRSKKIKKGEDLFACILCICMSSLVKGLDIEKYIRLNKIPNIRISPDKRQLFEENYQKALQMEKKYNHSIKDWRFYMPNLSKFYNAPFTVKNLTDIANDKIIGKVKTLPPIYSILGVLACMSSITNCISAVKNESLKENAKMSNLLPLGKYMHNASLIVLNITKDSTKRFINNEWTIGSLIFPFFSGANVVNIATAIGIAAIGETYMRARNAVDCDLAHIGKKVVEAKVMDFIVLPELKLVKKYPFFKPILFAQPGNLLEIGSQVRQLYKEHAEAEFSTLLKKNTAVICGHEPNRPSTGTDNTDVIYDYVI